MTDAEKLVREISPEVQRIEEKMQAIADRIMADYAFTRDYPDLHRETLRKILKLAAWEGRRSV